MAYRSEQNRIGNKENYRDLNLSQYPNTLDTRANNPNMKGFINVGEGEIPDYVMAEYMNAALDGIMSVERALGATPMVPFDTVAGNIPGVIESGTVDGRLTRIEDGLFDIRYGGPGWENVPSRPTLSKHNHDGLNGHPDKINLTREVTDLLQKANLNVSLANGLIGSDLFVSKQNPIKIHTAIEDALSKSAGGTVSAPVEFTKSVKHRTHIDLTANELPVNTGITLVSDAQATTGKALQFSSTGVVGTLVTVSAAQRANLLYGKYIVAVRIKGSTNSASTIARMALGSTIQNITGADIGTGYKQLYFVFEQDHITKEQDLYIQKLATGETVTLSVDNVYIEPIYPAVLDR